MKPPSKSAGFEPEGTPKSTGYVSVSRESPNGLDSKSAAGSFVRAGNSEEDPGPGNSNVASNGARGSNGNKASENGDAPKEQDNSVANGNGAGAEQKPKNGAAELSLDEQVNKWCVGLVSISAAFGGGGGGANFSAVFKKKKTMGVVFISFIFDLSALYSFEERHR